MTNAQRSNLGGLGRIVAGLAAGAIALLAAARPAAAQSAASSGRFGDKGQFAITGEDLMGYYSDTASYKDANGNEISDKTDHFSLLFNTRGATVGVHYFIIPSLSLGGTLGYESRGGSTTAASGAVTQTRDKGAESTFMLAPKVGYALMLSDMFGFWFRGGLAFMKDTRHTNAANDTDKDVLSYWLLTADALFVASPVPHLGFYAGPTFDMSLSGNYDSTRVVNGGPNNGQVRTDSYDAKWQRIALGLGIIGYF